MHIFGHHLRTQWLLRAFFMGELCFIVGASRIAAQQPFAPMSDTARGAPLAAPLVFTGSHGG